MKKFSRYIWIMLFAPFALGAIWFSWLACREAYNYSTLKAHTLAQSVQWSVVELSDEHYALQGSYAFTVGGVQYFGVTTLDDPPYRNAWAATKAIPEHALKQWNVWYSPINLAHSSLQKKFPFKQCVSSIILWGILIYFIGLKLYCTKTDFKELS